VVGTPYSREIKIEAKSICISLLLFNGKYYHGHQVNQGFFTGANLTGAVATTATAGSTLSSSERKSAEQGPFPRHFFDNL
jgi:hypothetical protein